MGKSKREEDLNKFGRKIGDREISKFMKWIFKERYILVFIVGISISRFRLIHINWSVLLVCSRLTWALKPRNSCYTMFPKIYWSGDTTRVSETYSEGNSPNVYTLSLNKLNYYNTHNNSTLLTKYMNITKG